MSPPTQSPTDHSPIDVAIAAFHKRLDERGHVDRRAFLREHGDVAEDLQAYWQQLDQLEQALGPFVEGPSQADTVTQQVLVQTSSSGAKPNRSKRPQLQSSTKFGRYEILKPLGEGGMGMVYLGRDTVLDREVAIKLPHMDSLNSVEIRARFLREAQAAASLRHPNICPVYDAGEVDGQPFISMGYVRGKPLSAIIAEKKSITIPGAVKLVGQIALAMQEAHAAGIVHRDLKPANIMLSENKQPVVMDFGLATPMELNSTRITQSGMIVGTPAYMAPEQAMRSGSELSPAADIYSLGVILYELLTYQIPFDGNAAQIIGQLLTCIPAAPSTHRPEIGPQLDVVCLKALNKSIPDRFTSMKEFAESLKLSLRRRSSVTANVTQPQTAEQLNSVSDDTAIEAFPSLAEHTPRARRRSRRRLQGLIASGICLALLVAASIIFLKTEHGDLKINYEGDVIEVVIKQQQKVHKTLEVSMVLPNTIELRKGEYQLELRGVNADRMTISPREITITGNNQTLAVITELPMPPGKTPNENQQPLDTSVPQPAAKRETLPPDVQKKILGTLAWCDVAGDKRRPLSVRTDLGFCTVFPGRFGDVQLTSFDGRSKSAGKVGSREPFPFCWIDSALSEIQVARRAARGQAKSEQDAYLAIRDNGIVKFLKGRVLRTSEFSSENGQLMNGPVFNTSGECLGYALSLQPRQNYPIYELRRE